jgi:NADPH2:quinone reductase
VTSYGRGSLGLKVVRVHRYGDPDVLTYEEIPEPVPGRGEVLVRLKAIGVNFIDVYFRRGVFDVRLPFVPGVEAAGVVEELGSEVSEVGIGDRVVYARVLGAYAEYSVVPVERLIKIPDGVDFSTAAAVMLQGVTAHFLSHSAYAVKQGDVVLVHAAAGGVGLLLVQLAKMKGAKVIGVVSSEVKAALAREFGADEIVLYSKPDWDQEVRRITGGRGVQVVYDSVGKDTFEKSLNCLAPRGYLVLYGRSSGSAPPVSPDQLMCRGSLFITRPVFAHYTASREELVERARAVLEWVKSGQLRLHVYGTFELGEASLAHRLIESRVTVGKILLLPPR